MVFKGTAPKPKKLKVTKDKRRCDKSPKFDQSLVVKDGKLANVVVYISDVKGRQEDGGERGHLRPEWLRVSAACFGGSGWPEVAILNPDKVLHNIHTYSKINKPMNRAQPKYQEEAEGEVRETGDHGSQMRRPRLMAGWIFVAGNPYYSVTGEDGAFSLTDLPAGKYKVEIWHEKLGTQTKEVEVKAGETAKLDIEFAG